MDGKMIKLYYNYYENYRYLSSFLHKGFKVFRSSFYCKIPLLDILKLKFMNYGITLYKCTVTIRFQDCVNVVFEKFITERTIHKMFENYYKNRLLISTSLHIILYPVSGIDESSTSLTTSISKDYLIRILEADSNISRVDSREWTYL